jgi:superfamily II DNA or RNA helicase
MILPVDFGALMIPNSLRMLETPQVTGATAIYSYTEALAKRYTVMSRFGEPVQLWSEGNGYIRLPRAFCPMSANDNRIVGGKAVFTSNVVPRNAEQFRVIKECCSLLDAGESFIVQASTGFGKTIVTMPIVAHVGRKTLIVVTKEDLIDHWRASIVKHLGIPTQKIGFIRQDSFDVVGKDIVIAMIHSLAIEGRYPLWLRKEFGFVIFDECHVLGAETFARVAAMFPAKLRMGLSATPERADGKEVVFYGHIGPVLVKTALITMPPKVLVYRSSWTCPRVMRQSEVTGKRSLVRLPHSPGKSGHVLKILCHDHNRNQMLAELAATAWGRKRKTVVFSDLLEHLQTLHDLTMGHGVPSSDMAFYIGGMKKNEREHAKVKPIIWATYGMMSTGTDIPWLDCCVLAAPRSNVAQAVGRILREHPNKKQPMVLDIVDEDSPVFGGYLSSRLKYYQRVGAAVKQM